MAINQPTNQTHPQNQCHTHKEVVTGNLETLGIADEHEVNETREKQNCFIRIEKKKINIENHKTGFSKTKRHSRVQHIHNSIQ